MSMWDVDKSSDTRGNPGLNVSDQVAARMAHGTFGITLVDTASSVVARVALVDGKVEVYNSAGERIARVGVRESDTDGTVDVAKPGDTL